MSDTLVPDNDVQEVQAPEQDLSRARWVTDPLGRPIPVPEGVEIEDALESIRKTYMEDPNLRREVLARSQIRDFEGADDPTDPDARRGFLAKQSGWAVEPGDIDDFLIRADLARSDLLTEKYAKLKEHYPDSEFQVVSDISGEPTILYRHPGMDVAREVEAPEFSAGDMAALTGGVVSEDVAAEILMFLTTRGSTSIVRNMIKAATGAAAGEGVKSLVERARGFEHSQAGPIVERMVMTGTGAAAGVAIFDPISRIINVVRGVRGLTAPVDEAKMAMQFAETEGLPRLLPGQLNPVFESLQQQATGTSQRMKEAVRDTLATTAEKLASLRDELGDFRALSDSILNRAIAKEEALMLRAVNSNPAMTYANAGRGVHKGLQNFQELLAEREARAYKAAFEASKDTRLNIGRAQQLGSMIRSRVVGDVKFDELGLNLNVPLIPVNTPAFRSALKDLINLQPEIKLTVGNASPLEQLVRLRSTFFNLKNSDDLTGTERVGAAQIHRVLSEIMRNPRTLQGPKGHLKPTVTRAWRQAASLTTARERWTDRVFARFAATSDAPSKIAARLNLKNPDLVVDTRRALMASGQKQKWIAVQEAFKNHLLANPRRARNMFKTDRKDVLDMLISPADQKAMISVGDHLARIEGSAIQRMLKQGAIQADRALNLVNKGTRPEIKNLIEEVGGRDTPAGRALQASIIESLLQRSTKVVEGKTLLQKDKFLQGMHQFRNRGMLEEVFSPDTLKRIDNYEKYVSFLPDSMGAGEGIQKAEAASAVGGIFLPTPGAAMRSLKGFHTTSKNGIIAWMFTSPKAGRLLVGRGRTGTTDLNAFAGTLGVIVDNMSEMAESGSFNMSEEINVF